MNNQDSYSEDTARAQYSQRNYLAVQNVTLTKCGGTLCAFRNRLLPMPNEGP